MAKKTLESWIRDCQGDLDKEGPLSAIALVHMQGIIEKELHVTKFGEGGRVWKAQDLAKMFRNKAEAYCQDIDGVQTFQLVAFFNGSEEAEAWQPFRINVQNDTYSTMTEAPTKEGQTMQSMRHLEILTQAMMKERLAILANVNMPLNAALEVLRLTTERVKTAEEQNIELIQMLKETYLSQSTEETQNQIELEKAKRRTTIERAVIKHAPAVINRLTGREIVPQSTEDTAIIEAVAEKLTPEMVQQLGAVLPPEVAGVLAARLKKALEKKREEDEAIERRGDEIEADAEEVEQEEEEETNADEND